MGGATGLRLSEPGYRPQDTAGPVARPDRGILQQERRKTRHWVGGHRPPKNSVK